MLTITFVKQLSVTLIFLGILLNACLMGRIQNVEIQKIELRKYTEVLLFIKEPMYEEPTVVNVSIRNTDKKLRNKDVGNVFIIELDNYSGTEDILKTVSIELNSDGIMINYPENGRIIKKYASLGPYNIDYVVIESSR